jgi:glycosyltransferase involved in cell wall biosynthesis
MLTAGLVPSRGLHPGFHGALLARPPAGIAYEISPGCHSLLFPPERDQDNDPFLHCHLGELVVPARHYAVVHSARIPVLGAERWVVDTDDFLLPVTLGKAYLRRREDGTITSRTSIAGPEWPSVVARTRIMLLAYAHNSCAAVFCRPAGAVSAAQEWLRALRWSNLEDALLGKMLLLYPSQERVSHNVLARKWEDPEVRVVFCCGRDAARKRVTLALEVCSAAIGSNAAVRCCLIVPNALSSYASAYRRDRLEVHTDMPHAEVLRILATSHVLFHPSSWESVGTVLVEAASAGMAFVAARPGIRDDSGLLSDSGAMLVDAGRDDPTAAFLNALNWLCSERNAARSMAIRNYDLMGVSPWSLEYRDRALLRAYEPVTSGLASMPLSLGDLCRGTSCRELQVSEEALRGRELELRLALGSEESINLGFDLPGEIVRAGLMRRCVETAGT